VFRGGSCSYSAGFVRSAFRFWFRPSFSFSFLGFRVCLARSVR